MLQGSQQSSGGVAACMVWEPDRPLVRRGRNRPRSPFHEDLVGSIVQQMTRLSTGTGLTLSDRFDDASGLLNESRRYVDMPDTWRSMDTERLMDPYYGADTPRTQNVLEAVHTASRSNGRLALARDPRRLALEQISSSSLKPTYASGSFYDSSPVSRSVAKDRLMALEQMDRARVLGSRPEFNLAKNWKRDPHILTDPSGKVDVDIAGPTKTGGDTLVTVRIQGPTKLRRK